jgi:hypothetical protein
MLALVPINQQPEYLVRYCQSGSGSSEPHQPAIREQVISEIVEICAVDLFAHHCELIVLFASIVPEVIRAQTRGGSIQFWHCSTSAAWCIMTDQPIPITGCREYQIEHYSKYLYANTIQADPTRGEFYQEIDYLRQSRRSGHDGREDPYQMQQSDVIISILFGKEWLPIRAPLFLADYFECQPRPKR